MSFYRLARRFLPPALVRTLGNRNKIKRFTLDRLFYRLDAHPDKTYLLKHSAPARHIPKAALEDSAFIPHRLRQDYRIWYDQAQSEQLVRAHDVRIEPQTGWPMGPSSQLYLDLYPSGISPYLPVPAYRSIFDKQPVRQVDKAIILRDLNEPGYSHFYTDLMPRLAMAEAHGIDLSDYDIIISQAIAQRPYAQHLLKNAPIFLKAKSIVTQANEWIYCKEAIFGHCRVNPTENRYFHQTVTDVQASHPLAGPRGHRRVFLARAKHDRRRLRNQDAIIEILTAKDFEIIETNGLSLPEQIDIFAHCRHLAGIHGAGLANMLYRAGHPMSVFEITEPARPPLARNPLYHNMAASFGFDYGAIEGRNRDRVNLSIEVDADAFEKQFEAFWQYATRTASAA